MHLGAGLRQAWASPSADLAAACRRIEELGFDSIWLADNGLGYADSVEPVTTLAYAAAVTERARLGVSVLVLPEHSPVRLAQSMATVDRLSGGRLIAGFGVGRASPADAAYATPAGRRGDVYDEAIDVVLAAWEPGPVTYRGTHWSLENVSVHPKPQQSPRPPVWFGGGSEAALDRAARRGDGWTAAGSAPWKTAKPLAASMHQALERHGRDPGQFVMGKRVYLAVESDPATAMPRLRDGFQRVYGRPQMADTVPIHGSPDRLVDELSGLLDAGYRFLLLNPVYDDLEQTEAIAEAIMPALRAR